MKILWQKRNLVTGFDIGEPADLPFELQGLDEISLSNLSWCEIVKYSGIGFFPVEVIDMQALIAEKLANLKRNYEIVFNAGYTFEIEGKTEVLQMRQTDLINWLVFKDSCDDMIAAGSGDEPAPLRIRCTSNRAYVVTADRGRQIMLAMRMHGASLLSQLWAKKDAIEVATTPEQLAAVSLDFI